MISDFSVISAPAWSQLCQVSVLILAVGLATRLFCRKRPHLAYVLWLLVVVKCLIPPVWSSPTGIFSWAAAWRTASTAIENPPGDSTIIQSKQNDVLVSDGNMDVAPGSNNHAESSAVVAPVVVPSRRLDPATMVVLLWLAGAASYAGMLIVMRVTWSWRLRRSSVSVEPDWTELLDTLRRRLGIRRKVRLLVTTQSVGPAVYGLLRPTLVMPETILSKETTKKLEAVLAHELIHVRRGDTLVGLLQVLAQTLWWFHPLVWWANRELVRLRERCCDEEVLAGLKCNQAEYAQSLIDLLKLKRSLRTITALPGIRPVEVTSRRLENIMDDTRQFNTRTPRLYWMVLAMGILAFVPGAGMTLGDSTPLGDESTVAKPTVANHKASKPKASDSKGIQSTADIIRPFDLLNISALNTLINYPIGGVYLVEPSGTVSLGPAYGRAEVKGMTQQEAEDSVLKQLKITLRSPETMVSLAGRATHWYRAVLPKAPYRVKPGDVVQIHVLKTLNDHPIVGNYLVETSGKVNLGLPYRHVQIKDMTLDEAETAIEKHLKNILPEPEVAVTMFGWKTKSVALPKAPYRIEPGELLEIMVANTLIVQPINNAYLVEATGRVCLGPAYGRVDVNGMTIPEAEVAIQDHLKKILRQPEVAVTPAGWKNPTHRLPRKIKQRK